MAARGLFHGPCQALIPGRANFYLFAVENLPSTKQKTSIHLFLRHLFPTRAVFRYTGLRDRRTPPCTIRCRTSAPRTHRSGSETRRTDPARRPFHAKAQEPEFTTRGDPRIAHLQAVAWKSRSSNSRAPADAFWRNPPQPQASAGRQR